MSYIYEPTGRAREYAPLALNIFSGCPGGCSYCYAKDRWHRTGADPVSRFKTPADWRRLEREAAAMSGDPRPIMLCFTCDPYPHPWRHKAAWPVSDQVLRILLAAGLHVRILSKGGVLPEIPMGNAGQVEFGQSLTFTALADWRENEPGTAEFGERVRALATAKSGGVRTFVSLEPVVDPVGLTAWLRLGQGRYIDRFNIGGPPNHCGWADPCTPGQLAALVQAAKGTGAKVGFKWDAWSILATLPPDEYARTVEGCERLWEVKAI